MDLKDSRILQSGGGDYWYFAGKRDLLERILKRLPEKGDMEILSVGCGVGSELDTLSRYGRVTALDCDEETLRRLPDGYMKVKAGIEEYPQAGRYDLVVMLDVLEHIQDDRRALERTLQALKADGIAIISAPAGRRLYGPHDLYLGHFRRYGMKELKRLLEEAGFKEVRMSYWNSLLYPMVALHKMLQRLLWNNKPRSSLIRLPRALNAVLSSILAVENRLRGLLPMPFGTTLMAIARK